MDNDYLHKLTKTELVNLIANLESLIVSIKTQLLESVAREDDYEDTIKMLIVHELKHFKPKGNDYDRLIRFKPTTHRATSF
jgi:hypothetical protein